MATSSSKAVKLTLSVDTLGEGDIKTLQTEINRLASDGSAAAPAFKKLADEINRLGEQNDALQNFRALSDQTDALAAQQGQAAVKVEELSAALKNQQATVAGAREKQQAATADLIEAQRANIDAGNALRLLKVEYDNAGKKTDEYRAKLKEQVEAQNAARASILDFRTAQQQATTEVAQAVAAQSKLETAYRSAAKQSDAAAQALGQQQTALQQSVASASALGVATDNIAASEGTLVAAFNEATTAAVRRNAEIVEMAEADRLLAVQEKAMNALLSESQRELNALTLAQVDATAAVRAYDAARAATLAAGSRWQAEAEGIVNAAHAAQELARQTQVAAAAARELSAQDAFTKAAADSQKLIQAANYVQFWERSLQEAEDQVEKTATAAKEAAKKIASAFDTVGVKSVEALRLELQQTRDAMDALRVRAAATGESLSGAFTAGDAKVKALERDIRELNGTLTTGDKISGLFKNSLGQIAAGNLIADGVGFLVNKVKELSTAFVETIAKQQQFTRALNAIYKDSDITAQQIAFLKQTALDAGVAVGGIQQSFVKFSASTKAANIPLAESNALFESLVKAGGTLGLTSEDVAGSLEALSQMAAKGTVSMEELRQQLGDRLPGALSLVSKGLGITDAALIKLVESGGLAARDLFPALTKALQTMQGEVSGITPAWENFKNALTGAAQSAGDSGWTEVLTLGVRSLAAVVGLVVLPLTALSETIGFLAKSAGVLAAALVTGTNPMERLGELALEASERQAKLTDAFDRAIGFTDALTKATVAHGQAVASASGKIKGLADVAVSTELGQKALALATSLAGNASLDASQKWVQLSSKIAELLSAQTKQTEAADKSAKATKTEGEAVSALAAIRGNEQATLEASATSATRYVDALVKATNAHQTETDLLNVSKAAFMDSAQARGLTVAQIEAEITAMDGKIAKSQAETDQSRAAADSARLDAAAHDVAAKSYRDNSDSIQAYRNAMIAAEATAAVLRDGLAAGIGTKERSRDADISAAKATALYRDALADNVTKIQALSTVEQARIGVQQAGLSVTQQAYTQLAAAARFYGDSAAAVYYEIEAKRVQIQVTQLQAKAKRLEAEAEIAAIEALREELIASGNLTEIKRKELEARTLNAKAKAIEAGASETVIRGLEAEITAIRKLQNERGSDTGSRQQNSGAMDGQTSSLSRLNNEKEREIALAKQAASDPYGRSPTQIDNLSKQGGPVDASYVFDIERRLNKGESFGPDELAALQNAYKVAQSNASLGNAGSTSLEGRADDMKWVNITRRALEQAQAAADALAIAAKKGTTPTTPIGITPQVVQPTVTPQTTTTNTSHTVTLNLNGKSTTINTATAADASALAAVLKNLETAAGTSS